VEFAWDQAAGRPSFLPIEPSRVASAVEAATAALARGSTPRQALGEAIDALHTYLDSAFVAALVAEHDRLWLIDSRGLVVTPDGVPFDVGIVGRAARSRRTQYIPDLAADPSYVEVVRGMSSEIAIPLVVGDDLVGVVNIETSSALPKQSPRLLRPLAELLAPVVAAIRDDRMLDLSSIARLLVYVSSLRDPQEIADIVVGALARFLPTETTQLLLRTEDGGLELVSACQSSSDAPEPLAMHEIVALRDQSSLSTIIAEVDLAELPGGGPRTTARTAVLLPLRAHGADLGALVATSRWRQQITRQQAEVASVLAAQAAAAIDAALSIGRERRSALTDSLTGLLNRRGFELEMEKALATAEELRLPLSLWVLDCDDFKEVNDRAGHEFGDALLREVGHVLAAIVPESAQAGRLGGDEFVVMLPGTDPIAAEQIAETARAQLAAGLDDAGFPLRLSGGIATYPFDGGGASQLLRASDQALYEAKETGKNQIVGFRALVRDGSRSSTGRNLSGSGSARTGRSETAVLVEAAEAATAISRETTIEAVLERLAKTTTFVVGATGCNLSRVVGETLFDMTAHSLRDVDLEAGVAYLIDDFPVTKAALESGKACSISFLDDDLDRAEAFVLRKIKMNCALLLPIVVDGSSWGLAELYDVRLRRFSREQQAIAEFLVAMAARRIETLGAPLARRPLLPMYRPPDARETA
jgi:diguanylate cyclase (GGDEF)-like protein